MSFKEHLDSLSLDELRQLNQEIGTAIKKFKERKDQAILAEVNEVLARNKASWQDLRDLDQTENGSYAPNLPPKFRHPEFPHMCWSGAGREHLWFSELREAGYSKEDLQIIKDEAP